MNEGQNVNQQIVVLSDSSIIFFFASLIFLVMLIFYKIEKKIPEGLIKWKQQLKTVRGMLCNHHKAWILNS